MLQYFFDTLDALFSGLELTTTAVFRLALIVFAVYLVWKYLWFLKKYPAKTIRITAAIVLWPFVVKGVVLFGISIIEGSWNGLLSFTAGICLASYLSSLIWPSSPPVAHTKRQGLSDLES
jgi:hypothetical protein